MSNFLKKPYEISVWKDILITEKNGTTLDKPYFDEQMIALIGSDTMTSPNRCKSPQLTENVNGEVTFTFSVTHRYFDEELGKVVFNPFVKNGYLVNERKIKLKYDNKWYDFIIKECEEDSESDLFNYTCTDLFVNELSKNGYHVELAQELANNQGTITELGKRVVEDIDWVIDEENSDPIRQWVQEPLYKGVLNQDIIVLKILNDKLKTTINEEVTINAGEKIYFFYSNIINKNTKNIHIMREIDRAQGKWTFDDNNVAKGPNYRIAEIEFVENTNRPNIIYETYTIINPVTAKSEIVTWSENLEFQGYRLNYGPISKYDPITEKYVDIYRAYYGSGNSTTYKDIYHYKDNEFTTSDILFNAVTNGDEFNVADESILGWNPHAGPSSKNNKIELTVSPKFDLEALTSLPTLEKLENTDGILGLRYSQWGCIENLKDGAYFFNSGIEDNATLLGGFTKGEKFVFRVKYDCDLKEPPTLGAIIAEYKVVTNNGFSYYDIDTSKIYFDFRTRRTQNANSNEYNFKFMEKPYFESGGYYYNYKFYNNTITGGHFYNDMTEYRKINGLGFEDVIPPSKKYVYQDNNFPEESQDYVWNAEVGKYVKKDEPNIDPQLGINWWYTIAECQKPLSVEDMQNKNIGIFITTSGFPGTPRSAYKKENESTYDLRLWKVRAVELFRYRKDANGEMLLLGSAPEAVSHDLDCFYLPDDSVKEKEEIENYTSLAALADHLNINESNIKQVFNSECEKITSVEVSQSNYFNIIQELCEKFECWAKFDVEREENGKIKLDKDNNPIKKISFHEYAGKDNFAGFKYGINLNSIQRTVESNEFVSKLIVAQTQNEFVDGGSLSIRYADANPLGESYIYNFSYYLNQGLIDSQDFYEYYNQFQSQMKALNKSINEKDKEYINIQNSLLKIEGTLNIYNETLQEAEIARQEAIDTIVQVAYKSTKNNEPNQIIKSYEDFLRNESKIPDDALDAVNEYIGKIIASQTLTSTYSGITYQLQSEFDTLQRKADGIPEYTIIITQTINGTVATINGFVEGLTLRFTSHNGNVQECKFDINNKSFTIPYPTKFLPERVEFVFDFTSNLFKEHDLCDEKREKLPSLNTSGTRYVQLVEFDSTKVYYLTVKENFVNDSLKKQLENLRKQKKELEKDFYKKYGRFIQEGTWQSEDYVDNNLYYLDALQTSNLSAKPQITYNINVVEVSELEGLSGYLFNVGDKTYIEDTEFFGWDIQENLKTPVREEVIVTETTWNLDSPEENTITIQNYKTQFEDLFNRISAAVQSVEYNTGAYQRAASMLDSNGLINSNLLTASLNNISGERFGISAMGAAYVDKDGIIVTDIMNTINQMKLSPKGLMVSKDAGVTWRTILTPDGISINYIKSGVLDVSKINIMDGNQTSFRWDKTGLNAYAFGNDSSNTYVLTTDIAPEPDKEYYTLSNIYTLVSEPNIYDLVNYYKKIEDEGQVIYEPIGYNELSNAIYYYYNEDGFYVEVEFPEIGELNNYYEIVEGEYIKTSDTEIVEGKTYYTCEFYVMVENPVIDDIAIYYINDPLSESGFKQLNYITDLPTEFYIISGKKWNVANLDEGFVNLYEKVSISTYDFSKYVRFDKYGVYGVKDGTDFVPESVDDIEDKANFGLTWNGFFIKNSYTDGYISITEDEDIKVVKKVNGNEINKIKIGAIEKDSSGEPLRYGIYIKNDNNLEVFKTDDEGNAVFNNVSIRGSIKASVFEYEEIQAIGGIVVVRPSTAIKDIVGYVYDDEFDSGESGESQVIGLKVIVENPAIFDDEDNNTVPNYYCRFGADSGIYKVTIDEDKVVTIHDFTGENYQFEEIIGAALVSLATITEEGNILEVENNYGIAINSADSDNQFAKKTISLFEATASKNASDNVEIGINYRGILGTLPILNNVSDIYTNNMINTQGIYTDNIYIGNTNQYVAFYTDKNDNQKKLRIRANEIVFEAIDPDTQEPTGEWHNINQIEAEGVPGAPGEDAAVLVIDSSEGTVFRDNIGTTDLTVTIFYGSKVITNATQMYDTFGSGAYLEWEYKNNTDNWVTLFITDPRISDNGFTLSVNAEDVYNKVNFRCKLNI